MKNKTTIYCPQAIETIRTEKGTYLNIQAEDGSWISVYLNVKDAQNLMAEVKYDITNIVKLNYRREFESKIKKLN